MTRALYVHWPYCVSKCPYCDFNSHVAAGVDHAAWRDAYRREMMHYAEAMPKQPITSIFFGGGTPSLMEPETVGSIIDTAHKLWGLAADAEITLEANPSSAEADKFAGFCAAGVNRLSLGIQSLRDEALRFLGRAHNAGEALHAIELAARHFPRYSFDLIYARQGQTREEWQTELREALALAGGHLSLYQLTIEKGTAFGSRAVHGEVLTALDDDAVAMFEDTQAIMADAGMPAYEISNHARAGHESRHNLTYWTYGDYIGIGPGAHGRVSGLMSADGTTATDNIRMPDAWMEQVAMQGHGRRVAEPVSLYDAECEALMMNLRLVAGINKADWQSKFGRDLVGTGGMIAPGKLVPLIKNGYVVDSPTHLTATAEGRQRLNAVLGYLFGAAVAKAY